VQETNPFLLYINQYGSMRSRTYSTERGFSAPLNTGSTLDPYLLTGFADGEGCFRIVLTKRDNLVG
jgi:hypothetical protein